MSVVVTRFLAVALALFLAPFASPCEDIAVFSRDAKYMILDGETLAPKDVGDLRRMGVGRVVSVLPGSTIERFAITSTRLPAEIAQFDESGRWPKSGLVVMANLAYDGGRLTRTAFSLEYELHLGEAVWIDGSDKLLIRDRERSRLVVVDEYLAEVSSWPADGFGGAMVACREAGTIYAAAGSRRAVLSEREIALAPLTVDGLTECSLARGWLLQDRLALGCRATLACRRDERQVYAIVDIAGNELIGQHEWTAKPANERDMAGQTVAGERRRLRYTLLFEEGLSLVRQTERLVPEPPGFNSFRSLPAPGLRAIDTRNGEVRVENPEAPAGVASRVFCRGTTERTTLSGDGQVHLVDLGTLKAIASARIPFNRPFVF